MIKKIIESLLGQKKHRRYSSSDRFRRPRHYSSSDYKKHRSSHKHGSYGYQHYKGKRKRSSFFSSYSS
ncbi:hypothetical protein [Metabacillus iocasae]|uniref:Zn-finger nucleic acid-binding protein n=1 Tax=Priestia iocasae TaxID=2291674 RepID=A0ABS2QUQ9_9BACI|nr:hypothetical protein [Metabacillus iocasae]MBM7703172.1 Zn-finger nucleic acid-binding protein [Metabacillus iocasae]